MKTLLLAAVLILASFGASAQNLVEENFKLINVVGVQVTSGFAYVALFGLETTECPPIGLLGLEVGTESERALFSSLVAAKTANRAVSLTVEVVAGGGCIVRSAVVH